MQDKGIFIAVEGVIGVGKTTLCQLIQEHYQFSKLNEIVDENPFLAKFYEDRDAYALQTEAFFLFNRIKQMDDLNKEVLSKGLSAVSDYHVIKNLIFAGLTLNAQQLHKYKLVYQTLAADLPTPDIILYLHSDIDEVMSRIEKRNRSFENNMDRQYIEDLAQEYSYYFHPSFIKHHFNGKLPLIIPINTTNLDVVANEKDRAYIFAIIDEAIQNIRKGA